MAAEAALLTVLNAAPGFTRAEFPTAVTVGPESLRSDRFMGMGGLTSSESSSSIWWLWRGRKMGMVAGETEETEETVADCCSFGMV